MSVIGGHDCDDMVASIAERIGEVIAAEDAVLVSGGLGGIMEAASKGAKGAGGVTIGIIPGEDKEEANEFVDIVIPTGMGYSRNALVAGTGDMVIALPGKYGTLSEIAFALNGKKKVYGFNSWDIPGVETIGSPDDLAAIIKENRGW